MIAPTLLLAALLAASTEPASAPDRVVRGEAFDVRTGDLVYREVHHETWLDGRLLRSSVDYLTTTGEPISRKWIVPRTLPWAPGYEILDRRSAAREAALPAGSQIDLAWQRGERSTVRHGRADLDDTVVVDAGLYPFVAANWQRLLGGEALTLRIPVPWRLALYDFRLRRVEGDDTSRVTFELAASSFMVRLVLDPIRLVYDAADRTLLEQIGRTGIADDAGDPIVARVVYEGGAPLAPPDRSKPAEP